MAASGVKGSLASSVTTERSTTASREAVLGGGSATAPFLHRAGDLGIHAVARLKRQSPCPVVGGAPCWRLGSAKIQPSGACRR
jgi:hypothetical protein